MRGKPGKAGRGAPSVVSPGGTQRYMSAKTSISEDGHCSPRQIVSARTEAGKQKMTEEETSRKGERYICGAAKKCWEYSPWKL